MREITETFKPYICARLEEYQQAVQDYILLWVSEVEFNKMDSAFLAFEAAL